jgi:hypothetical protein
MVGRYIIPAVFTSTFFQTPTKKPLNLTMTASPQSLLLVVLLLLVTSYSHAFKEPKTGVVFPDKFQGSSIDKTGVRTKGPIKVYAVGQYDKTFLLQMTFGIAAEKMALALKDALKPRCKDASTIDEFEALMLKGLPKGAAKGTKLAFGTSGGKLSLQVDGKNVGTIGSKPLATAFAGIYTDKNAVCAMKPVNSMDDGDSEETSSGLGRLLSPQICAGVGAAVGYGVGKLLH